MTEIITKDLYVTLKVPVTLAADAESELGFALEDEDMENSTLEQAAIAAAHKAIQKIDSAADVYELLFDIEIAWEPEPEEY